MSKYRFGSVWAVAGVRDSLAVVLAGPFGGEGDEEEFVIAPFYVHQPDHFWSDLEFQVSQDESPLNVESLVALWNVHTLRRSDLLLSAGSLSEDVAEQVRDVYFASLTEAKLPHRDRLGRRIRWYHGRARQFVDEELQRWRAVGSSAMSRSEAAVPVSEPRIVGITFEGCGVPLFVHGPEVWEYVLSVTSTEKSEMTIPAGTPLEVSGSGATYKASLTYDDLQVEGLYTNVLSQISKIVLRDADGFASDSPAPAAEVA